MVLVLLAAVGPWTSFAARFMVQGRLFDRWLLCSTAVCIVSMECFHRGMTDGKGGKHNSQKKRLVCKPRTGMTASNAGDMKHEGDAAIKQG